MYYRSRVKMSRGSPICKIKKVRKNIMEYSWKHSSFERRPHAFAWPRMLRGGPPAHFWQVGHPPPQTLGIRLINPDHVLGSIPPRGCTGAHQRFCPPKSVQPLSTGWRSAIPLQEQSIKKGSNKNGVDLPISPKLQYTIIYSG